MTSISVVIPCFEHGRFLREAIDSVLGSTLPDAQVIVVDDGSTDDTSEVARSYGPRVQLIEQPNLGLSAARNAGFAAADGDLVQFLDADDRIDPTFLERVVLAADLAPDTDVFCGAWDWCDADNRPLDSGSVAFPADVYPFLLGGNRMPCHAVVVRRAALGDAPPFDPSLRALEDWDLWLRLAKAGRRFASVPDAKVSYRRHEGSMSRDIGRMLGAASTVLRRHRGAHLLARLRGMRAIRYGCYCENVLPRLGRSFAAYSRALLRHPAVIEGALLHVALRVCPPLRRRLGVLERPFASQVAGADAGADS